MASGNAALQPHDIPSLSRDATVRDVFPSWDRLELMLVSSVAEIKKLCQELPALPAALGTYGGEMQGSEKVVNASDVAASVAVHSQNAIKQTLMWAQKTKSVTAEVGRDIKLTLPQSLQNLAAFLSRGSKMLFSYHNFITWNYKREKTSTPCRSLP